MISLNISATAANETTVYLRFGWSARVYFWMIDDITLSEADPLISPCSIHGGEWEDLSTSTTKHQLRMLHQLRSILI